MTRRLFFTCCLLLTSYAWSADDLIVDIDSTKFFKIDSGTCAPIKLFVQEDGVADVSILSPDGFVVKSFNGIELRQNTQKEVCWDGLDESKTKVPSEVYFPHVTFRPKGHIADVIEYSPLLNSGGKILTDIPLSLTESNQVVMRLNRPARLLVRAGISDGPLLRTLSTWQPYPAGRIDLDWNGKDVSGDINIESMRGFTVFATGYELPDGAIFIDGSSSTYPEYCQKITAVPDLRVLRANYLSISNKLSDVFSDSHCYPADPIPEIELSIDKAKLAKLKVSVPAQYTTYVKQDLYEVTIFVDNKFVDEREQGYMPFYWEKDFSDITENTPHLMTVNITGFKGYIGAASTLFYVRN